MKVQRNQTQRYASKKRMYGGGSGISVGAEQYGVFESGNPAGARADFEAMARDAADSMIAYPSEIFPRDLVEQKGGGMNNNMTGSDMSGNEMSEVMKMMASDSNAMGGRRRTRKGRRSAVRKTMYGGKRKAMCVGGKRKTMCVGGKRKAMCVGGKRKTMCVGGKRKLGKALSEWNKSVMKVFREMKSKNKDVKLKDAMKETKRRKDHGQL
jgi:hypothetical protein